MLAGLVACSNQPYASEQTSVGMASIDAAQIAGAGDLSVPEMALARDKLARAQAAAKAGDSTKARYLAEEADVDAQVARSKIAADKSQKAWREVDAGLASLREEMSRQPSATPGAVRP